MWTILCKSALGFRLRNWRSMSHTRGVSVTTSTTLQIAKSFDVLLFYHCATDVDYDLYAILSAIRVIQRVAVYLITASQHAASRRYVSQSSYGTVARWPQSRL